MQLLANERHIRFNTRLGLWAAFGGMGMLIGAVVVSWLAPNLWGVMLALIWVGFILSLIGGYNGDRYAGPLAHHQKLSESLKGLDDNHTLVLYRLPAPYVLVEPGGVTVIVPKSSQGAVSYTGGRWRHQEKWGWFKRMAGQEPLGAPDHEARRMEKKLGQYLSQKLPEGVKIPIRSVILFTNPQLQLEADDSPVTALRAGKVKEWLRGPGRQLPLPMAVRKQLAAALNLSPEE